MTAVEEHKVLVPVTTNMTRQYDMYGTINFNMHPKNAKIPCIASMPVWVHAVTEWQIMCQLSLPYTDLVLYMST